MYVPQDGYWLASFEVIPPPQKVGSSAPAAKKVTFYLDAHPLLKKTIRPTNCLSSFPAVFVGFVTPIWTLANNLRACPKKREISGQNSKFKLLFSVFPARNLSRFCHAVLDFREQQAVLPD